MSNSDPEKRKRIADGESVEESVVEEPKDDQNDDRPVDVNPIENQIG